MILFKKILKSVILTLSISFLVSFALSLLGIPFLSIFILVTFLQFIFFYFYGEYNKKIKEKLYIQTELKLLEEKNFQSLSVVCPCDKKIESIIGIKLNKTNSYICQGCNKSVNVFIETKTALSTVPISVNPLDVPQITDSIEKIINNK